jgi:hypothetical protein
MRSATVYIFGGKAIAAGLGENVFSLIFANHEDIKKRANAPSFNSS